MDKKHFAATVLTGAVMFAAGFLVRMTLEGPAQTETPQAEGDLETVEQSREVVLEELMAQGYIDAGKLQVRIDDGQVQWYDGEIWHDTASVEELEKEDRFYLAEENFKAFQEELSQEREAERAQESVIPPEETTLLVGQKETPKPAQKPKSNGSSSPKQGGSSVPAADPGYSWDDQGSSDNNQPAASQPASPPQDTTPAAPPAPEPEPPSGGDTGDGENMEWSDDYL